MKKTKIVVPALGILLLSTAASVTGTVAWFSASGEAKASGMQIKAKVDANLFIEDGVIAALDNVVHSEITLTSKALEVKPADMQYNSTNKQVDVAYADTYTTAPTVGTAGVAATYGSAGLLGQNAISGTAATINGYCVYNYVTIARKQSEEGKKFNLAAEAKVTFAAESLLNKAFRVGVLSETGWVPSTDMNTASGSATFSVGQVAASLTDNAVHYLCLVAWFDGNDSDCFTNNAATLSQNTIDWTFTATDAA